VWLDENAAPNDFVLADVPTSQLVAQQTQLRVYVGHEMETLQYEDKVKAMEYFFEGAASKDWLEQTRVKWVIYEKKNSSSFAPSSELELVYENETVIIYKVKR
jgi:hypothetical protein